MATLSKEDILTYSVADLQERMNDDRMHLRKLRFNHAISPLDNPNQLSAIKKEIARINTELRRRQLEKAQ